MKMLMLALAFAVLLAVPAAAVTDFELVAGGAAPDRGVFVAPVRDGGYIAVGATGSTGAGSEDVYLVRVDADGQALWEATCGGPDVDNGWSIHEIDGGFILAGFTRSFGAGDFDFYLVRTDTVGNEVWSRTYGGQGKDRCWSLLPTDDGGYVLAGETTSSGAGEEDFYVVKTDAEGNEQWSRTYGGPAGDRCFAVAGTADGGYVLAGQTYSEGAGDRDAFVIRTDAGGDQLWSRTFGGPASDVGHALTATADGAFVVTGYTTSFANTGDDPYITKFDDTGEVHWTRVLDVPGNAHTLTGAQDVSGGFHLVGFIDERGRGGRAALLVRTDAEGRLVSSRSILATPMGESFGYTVTAAPGGGCVFTGHTTVNSAGAIDLLVVGVPGD